MVLLARVVVERKRQGGFEEAVVLWGARPPVECVLR